MMDIGQPDQKRPRIGSGSGSWSNPSQHPRALPPPPTGPPQPQFQQASPFSRPDSQPRTHPLDDRRHRDHEPEYAIHPEPHRPLSGPSHGYHHPAYAGPRDPIVKRDSSDEPIPHHIGRPPSTGNPPDHNGNSHNPDDHRRYVMPGYEAPPVQGPPYRTSSYPPPPLTPMATSQPYEHPTYGLSPASRDPYPAPYPPPGPNTAKRKPQRAAQACDSCRTLKAKCDETKPCTSCREKNIPCNYRDPPPKQQDKASADILESLSRLESSLTALTSVTSTLSGNFTDLASEYTNLSGKVNHMEKVLLSKVSSTAVDLKDEPPESVNLSCYPAAEPAPVAEPLPVLSNISPYISTSVEQPVLENVAHTEEEDEDEGGADPGPPGKSAIPQNHTTGAARLLLIGPIADMTRGVMKEEKIKNEKYPFVQEERRGLLRLYGRGEGLDLAPGYDKDSLTDQASDGTPSDAYSDASSPAAGDEWGQLGGMTPPPNVDIIRPSVDQLGMPDFTPEVVYDLVETYMKHMNNMHPILIPRHVDALIKRFLKSIPESPPKHRAVQALFAVGNQHGGIPDSPGSKRKRSPSGIDPPEIGITVDYKPGHPFRSISTALVLLVLALGRICKQKGKIPDVVHGSDRDYLNSWTGSPQLKNGHPLSPLQGSPTMSTQSSGLPSPQDISVKPRSRRSSVDYPPGRPFSKLKNMDVIPGLEYFALATDIIGNQLAGNSLQHVHVNILAALYHGQLARVLESSTYIHAACRSLQVILRPKLERYKGYKADPTSRPPAKDNPLIFAFWTCLQLESDIIAELPCPHSGILTFEEDMPYPNVDAAANVDGFSPYVVESYMAQLFLRKHLNLLHTMFYNPETSSQYPHFSSPNTPHFRTIEAVEHNLEQISIYAPHMTWFENDPPATDILAARLRAKYYGAQVITYRHFVLKILEHSATKSSHPGFQISNDFKTEINVPSINKNATTMEDIPPQIVYYAKKCVKALIKSTTAFSNVVDVTKERLLVTNVWGTAHAQWGNILTLQAVSQSDILKSLITEEELRGLLKQTIGFLDMVAQPSSALATDSKILKYTGMKLGLLSRLSRPDTIGSSFSSSASGGVPDVMMSGH